MHQDGVSPLLAACKGGHKEIAQLLIEKGADVNEGDNVSIYNILILKLEFLYYCIWLSMIVLHCS